MPQHFRFPFATGEAGAGLLPVRPQVAGLLARRRPNVFQRVFGIDPNQPGAQAAQQQALLQAGLQMLAASQPQPIRPSLGGILAQGVATGRGAATQAQQGAARQALQERVAAITGGGPITVQALQQVFGEALAAGDIETARAIAGFFGPLAAMQEGRRPPRTTTQRVQRDGQTKLVLFNAETGEEIAELGEAAPSGIAAFGRAPVTVFDPATGDNVLARFMPEANLFVEAGTGRVLADAAPKAPLPPTDQVVTARANLNDFRVSIDELRAQGASPSVLEKLGSRSDFIRGAVPEQAQIYFAAANGISSLIVLMRSGRQASDQERRALFDAYIPLPGEGKSTIDFKLRRLEGLFQAMQGLASGRPISSKARGALDTLDDLLGPERAREKKLEEVLQKIENLSP